MKPIAVKFNHVKKSFKSEIIIPDLSFEVVQGLFVTILGSSGSGKTTTLKMVNQLIKPDSGTIEINGQKIEDKNLIEMRREMGYVVQQIGLFPHLTIEKNIATVPKILKWEPSKIDARINELMELIQLPTEYRKKYPEELSGGQQQRVGVARALAADPKIMLLDEPFGAVDAITRKELQMEIKKIHKTLSDKIFLLVTHDIHEAFYLGDKVIIMNEGKISQFDTPENIVKNPKDEFVQNLLDTIYKEDELWRELK